MTHFQVWLGKKQYYYSPLIDLIILKVFLSYYISINQLVDNYIPHLQSLDFCNILLLILPCIKLFVILSIFNNKIMEHQTSIKTSLAIFYCFDIQISFINFQNIILLLPKYHSLRRARSEAAYLLYSFKYLVKFYPLKL